MPLLRDHIYYNSTLTGFWVVAIYIQYEFGACKLCHVSIKILFENKKVSKFQHFPLEFYCESDEILIKNVFILSVLNTHTVNYDWELFNNLFLFPKNKRKIVIFKRNSFFAIFLWGKINFVCNISILGLFLRKTINGNIDLSHNSQCVELNEICE